MHYENNNPFLVVSSMTRVIEVSHWGNIAVEETYDVYHSGAKLKGSFSRYDYQRTQDGYSSIKSYKVRFLPRAAQRVRCQQKCNVLHPCVKYMNQDVDPITYRCTGLYKL